jgi:hypothetical protein
MHNRGIWLNLLPGKIKTVKPQRFSQKLCMCNHKNVAIFWIEALYPAKKELMRKVKV